MPRETNCIKNSDMTEAKECNSHSVSRSEEVSDQNSPYNRSRPMSQMFEGCQLTQRLHTVTTPSAGIKGPTEGKERQTDRYIFFESYSDFSFCLNSVSSKQIAL